MPTVDDLRSGVASLSTLAAADLRDLWRSVSNAAEARAALSDILPALVTTYGAASATLAADWYDELRDEVGAAGRFFAITAAVDEQGADVLARWGIGPLFKDEPDWEAAQTLIDGGLQRRIANAARGTVTVSSLEDPQTRGWQRVTSGTSCSFCRMLAARGAVYSERGVDFASHDHCDCYATPAFRGEPKPVSAYRPSSRTITDADRARTRAYLAEHDAG